MTSLHLWLGAAPSAPKPCRNCYQADIPITTALTVKVSSIPAIIFSVLNFPGVDLYGGQGGQRPHNLC